MAVQVDGRRIILAAQGHVGDVLQQHLRSVGQRLHHHFLELIDRGEARARGDDRVQHLRVGHRLLADLAGRDLRILRGDRIRHIARLQVEAAQFVRVEPDAHRILRAEHIEIADALEAAQTILQMRNQIVADVDARALVGLVIDRDHHQEVGIGLGDDQALLLHLLGQTGQRLLHLVLHLYLGDVRIGALVEGHRDHHLTRRVG